MRALLALVLIAAAVLVLERARDGVDLQRSVVGRTPVTLYSRSDAQGPVVVVAHGFAGSQQMMQGYALPLARAGYRVHAFDFLGHGRNPLPMSGDVTRADGTTRLLVEQTQAVIDAVASGAQPVALLGHSMATDVLVRAAQARDDIGPMVLISAYSQQIDAEYPQTLLLISGAWEGRIRAEARAAVRQIDPDATEGETVRADTTSRRAIAAPFTEHVSVLHSRAGRAEALAWIDSAYGRTSNETILPTGWAILALLGGLVALFAALVRQIPQRDVTFPDLGRKDLALVIGLPMGATPLIAVPLNPDLLPVLVADYLGLHMLVFGALQIAFLRWRGARFGPIDWHAGALLLVICVAFGLAMDRYAANFWPTPQRLWIVAVLALGALAYMLADAMLTGAAPLWRRLVARAGFLASLGIAVALDFSGLFFLVMIAPVMVLFYLIFGTMGRLAARRSGALAPGLILGLMLAWALGISFPLFQN